MMLYSLTDRSETDYSGDGMSHSSSLSSLSSFIRDDPVQIPTESFKFPFSEIHVHDMIEKHNDCQGPWKILVNDEKYVVNV